MAFLSNLFHHDSIMNDYMTIEDSQDNSNLGFKYDQVTFEFCEPYPEDLDKFSKDVWDKV